MNKKNWEQAKVVYVNGSEENMYVYIPKIYYYNIIKAKNNTKGKTEILTPEKVKSVTIDNGKYISMFFNEVEYGMESYSFGQVLSGDSILVVKTKFQEKTCACKTSGAYFNGYFIVYNDIMLRININKKQNITNLNEINDFLNKHNSNIELEKNTYTVGDIINQIKNINNQTP